MRLRDNWLDSSTANECLERTWYYRRQSVSGWAVQEVLAGYLGEYPRLISRSKIEWQLAERVMNESLDGSITLPLADNILSRSSGAMLQWVVSQQLRCEMALAGRLAHYPSLTNKQALLFARAWAMLPENHCLKDDYERLFEWLKPRRKALGWAAVGFAGAAQSELAEECARLWLEVPPDDSHLFELLQSMLGYPVLENYGAEALHRTVRTFGSDYQLVEKLCRLAFDNWYPQEALLAAELLLPHLEGERYWAIDAVRIAALARLDKLEAHLAAIEAYRQRSL